MSKSVGWNTQGKSAPIRNWNSLMEPGLNSFKPSKPKVTLRVGGKPVGFLVDTVSPKEPKWTLAKRN